MASISPVRIANMALSHVGSASNIEALTENSPGAKQCNLWYDYSRRQALEAFDWSFARKRQALASHGDDPPDEWSFRYQLPSDCIAARRIWNPAGESADATPYEIEVSDNGTKSILTNQDDAILIFTFDQEQTSLFSAHFVETLSYILATHIAFAITGKRSIKQDMAVAAARMLRSAPAQNANEKVDAPPRDASWIAGR